jgi:hypothetical protein
MATQDEEQALLGILESSLGDRQRAMNGLHLDQVTSLEVHREMLELAARVAEQTAVEDLDQPGARRAGRANRQTSHRRPGPMSRWLQQTRDRRAGAARAPDLGPQPDTDTDTDTDTIDLRGLG